MMNYDKKSNKTIVKSNHLEDFQPFHRSRRKTQMGADKI